MPVSEFGDDVLGMLLRPAPLGWVVVVGKLGDFVSGRVGARAATSQIATISAAMMINAAAISSANP